MMLEPIIAGQIETWMKAHPGTRKGMKNGITKRVLGDICSAENLRRIELAVALGAAEGRAGTGPLCSRPAPAQRAEADLPISPT
jgi:hypothetical protein